MVADSGPPTSSSPGLYPRSPTFEYKGMLVGESEGRPGLEGLDQDFLDVMSSLTSR